MGGKRPFLYAVVADSPGGSYPVAYMLSEDHTVPTITHFLAHLSRSCKMVTGEPIAPPRVVCDNSWALMHSIAQGLCSTFPRDHLQACWDAVTDQKAPPQTFVSLCGSHISHQFSTILAEKGAAKKCRSSYQWLFAKMQMSTDLEQLSSIFRLVCQLALSTTQPELDQDAMHAQPTECAVPECESPDDGQEEGTTMRLGTPFGRHFNDLVNEVAKAAVDEEEVTNNFYCPKLPTYLAGLVMPLAPLWSQLLSSGTASNASVEANFRVLKKQVLLGRTRLHPSEFIRLLLAHIFAVQKASVIPSKPMPRGKKRGLVKSKGHQQSSNKRAKADTISTTSDLCEPNVSEEA